MLHHHSAGIALLALALPLAAQERFNHAGRLLGPPVAVKAPLSFNTPQADAVLASMQVFPASSAWHEDVSARPLLANSAAMMTNIRNDLATGRRTVYAFHEMNFALVPDAQPQVPIDFIDYPDESDPSPYPLPGLQPVEAWPREYPTYTLDEWQRDAYGDGGDRHTITVAPGSGGLWETWVAQLTETGWQAGNGARFDLNSNAMRPAGWTSGDAAGLAMFPALVRYDECQRGEVEHAMRIVVRVSRTTYFYPARHQAGSTSDVDRPGMGQRVRLKAAFAPGASWSVCEKAVVAALKKYGALVADNGGFFSISVTPDDRWAPGEFSNLRQIDVNQFDVVQTTGETQGPRSAGAPTAGAGADKALAWPANSVALGDSAATGSGTTIAWSKYSGPGTVTFSNAATLHPTATFSAPGRYLLRLGVSDGVHATAWDGVVVTVTDAACATPALPVVMTRVAKNGAGVTVTITDPNPGGQASGYNLRRAALPWLAPGQWSEIIRNGADANGAFAGVQLNDANAPGALWAYSVTANAEACGFEGPW